MGRTLVTDRMRTNKIRTPAQTSYPSTTLVSDYSVLLRLPKPKTHFTSLAVTSCQRVCHLKYSED
ncbi:unnamed protein product, partial [Ixodes pacificus]